VLNQAGQWIDVPNIPGTFVVNIGQGREIDSAFLRGKYHTWGETQLRTKIRSHQDVGRKFYGDVFDKYVKED
jgi:hypothetical protein